MNTMINDQSKLAVLPRTATITPEESRTKISPVREPLIVRLHRALGPLAGGIILDTTDFLTMGPFGLVFGLVLGGLVGWWVSSIYEFSDKARLRWAVLAGLYCAIPFTAPLPLATIISVISGLRERTVEPENPAS